MCSERVFVPDNQRPSRRSWDIAITWIRDERGGTLTLDHQHLYFEEIPLQGVPEILMLSSDALKKQTNEQNKEKKQHISLTAFWHHAFLHFCHLGLAHWSVYRRHLHHALASSHAQAAGDAAGVPLSPLSHHAAAGCCREVRRTKNTFSGSAHVPPRRRPVFGVLLHSACLNEPR